MIGYLNEHSGIQAIYCWQDLAREGANIIPHIDRRKGNYLIMFNYNADTGEKINWKKIKQQVAEYFNNLPDIESNEGAD